MVPSLFHHFLNRYQHQLDLNPQPQDDGAFILPLCHRCSLNKAVYGVALIAASLLTTLHFLCNLQMGPITLH
jgi:hypothetical protein